MQDNIAAFSLQALAKATQTPTCAPRQTACAKASSISSAHYGQPSGARVLDLFAGTGALGLEALSRGATHVTYVENGRAGQKLILENLTKARRTQDATLLKSDATSLPPAKIPCNLVFLDPPYGKALGEQALASARAQGWLSEDALVVWEESAPMYAPQGFTLEDQRKYGSTVITLLRA